MQRGWWAVLTPKLLELTMQPVETVGDRGRHRTTVGGGVSAFAQATRRSWISQSLLIARPWPINFQGSQIGSPKRLPLLVLPRPTLRIAR
jgi:hypothetical protein